jgi:uncharacterized protein (TIGR03437 family)
VAQETVQFAPVSGVFQASQTAPIPRFASVVPASDCGLLNDCGASFFPKLEVSGGPLQMSSYANGLPLTPQAFIRIHNAGGGIMNWSARVEYLNGSGWLQFVDTPSGQNGATLRPIVSKNAPGLAPGTYRANILIDAGPAGHDSVPVLLTVQPGPAAPVTTPPVTTPPVTAPPVTTPPVTVSQVVNAATFEVTPLVAGSLGTLKGSHLSGKSVAVTFDGLPATLFYTSDQQINFQVPEGLGAKTSASLIVTVDGANSAAQTVALSPAWPSIFAHGVLNQEYSENKAGSAAKAHSVLQIFGTGISPGSLVSVRIADRENLVPLYAAGAPGLTGVQQVNVEIPEGLTPSMVQLTICVQSAAKQFCSAPYQIAVE